MNVWLDDPTPRIESVFRRIGRESFADIDLCNRALEVRAVGFAPREHGWSGIVITPWFLNLMLFPSTSAWQHLGVGERRILELPAGSFEVLGGEDGELGEYAYCPMFSTMSLFESQREAVEVAEELIRQLTDPVTADVVRQRNPTGLQWNAPPAESTVEFHPARRDFLRGRAAAAGCANGE